MPDAHRLNPTTRDLRERHAPSWRDVLALLGAAGILAYSIHRLPPSAELLHLPATPLDRSRIHESATEYRILVEAARIIPPAGTVMVRSASRDPERDLFLHRFGVALLPGRRVLPAAVDGRAVSREIEAAAEYFVIVGPVAAVDGADRLLQNEDGSVWKAKRP